jgi:hypothetical protein
MIETYYIGAYWGSRKESLQQIAGKTFQTLQVLSEIDEQFFKWYDTGMSRKQALQNKLEIDEETIKKIALKRVKKGEMDENGFAVNGFLFSLWTGHIDEESSSITFAVGNTFNTDNITNSCVISIPFEGAARERLLHIEKAKKIIAVLVDIWAPDYSVLTSQSLNNKLNVINDIGWVTYRKSIKRLPNTTGQVVYERANNGHWFYVNESSYSDTLSDELLPMKGIF